MNECDKIIFLKNSIIKKILFKRGLTGEEESLKFLFPEYRDLYNPFLLKDSMKSAAKIIEAIDSQKKILIFGDKDADGLSGSAVLYKALKSLGADVQCKISEAEDDYDINEKIFALADKIKASLIITVDCGISACEVAANLKKLKIDFIITDHHEPKENLPDAYAIVNPKRIDCKYPDKYLSGSAVAFKMSESVFLLKTKMFFSEMETDLFLPESFYEDLRFLFFLEELLPIAAIGVIADVMPLKNENRTISRLAYKIIKKTNPVFIESLMNINNLSEINGDFFGFTLGPILNSCRRMKAGDAGFRWLVEKDISQIRKITLELIELNNKRKMKADEMYKTVIKDAENQVSTENRKIIILGYDNFDHGVTGLVANKIVEHFKMPVIIFIIEEGIAGGSGRCPDGINLFEIIELHKKYFIKYGGHKSSVGLSMNSADIESFKNEINIFLLKNQRYLQKTKDEKVTEDINFKDIDFNLLDSLELFEPFGKENDRPEFQSELPVKRAYPMGGDNKHLNLYLKSDLPARAIAWNKGVEADKINSFNSIRAKFSIKSNFYAGKKSICLQMNEIMY